MASWFQRLQAIVHAYWSESTDALQKQYQAGTPDGAVHADALQLSLGQLAAKRHNLKQALDQHLAKQQQLEASIRQLLASQQTSAAQQQARQLVTLDSDIKRAQHELAQLEQDFQELSHYQQLLQAHPSDQAEAWQTLEQMRLEQLAEQRLRQLGGDPDA